MDVHAVDDQADPDPIVREGDADQSGLAVMQRGHGVEQVRHPPHAGVDAGLGLSRGGAGVTGGHHHPAIDQGADHVEGAGQFRGQGDDRDPGVRRPAGDRVHVRRSQAVDRMGAAMGGSEERPLEVQSERRGEHGIVRQSARPCVEGGHGAVTDIGRRADDRRKP